MPRPPMNLVLMKTAFTIAERGTCSRRNVGCVLADDRGTIVSWAYNGALAGFPHCAPHTDFQPCETSEHAERNAIYWCARKGIATESLNAYCTDSPCHGCARALIQAGIKRVTYSRPYRDNSGLALLSSARIEVRCYPNVDVDWAKVGGLNE